MSNAGDAGGFPSSARLGNSLNLVVSVPNYEASFERSTQETHTNIISEQMACQLEIPCRPETPRMQTAVSFEKTFSQVVKMPDSTCSTVSGWPTPVPESRTESAKRSGALTDDFLIRPSTDIGREGRDEKEPDRQSSNIDGEDAFGHLDSCLSRVFRPLEKGNQESTEGERSLRSPALQSIAECEIPATSGLCEGGELCYENANFSDIADQHRSDTIAEVGSKTVQERQDASAFGVPSISPSCTSLAKSTQPDQWDECLEIPEAKENDSVMISIDYGIPYIPENNAAGTYMLAITPITLAEATNQSRANRALIGRLYRVRFQDESKQRQRHKTEIQVPDSGRSGPSEKSNQRSEGIDALEEQVQGHDIQHSIRTQEPEEEVQTEDRRRFDVLINRLKQQLSEDMTMRRGASSAETMQEHPDEHTATGVCELARDEKSAHRSCGSAVSERRSGSSRLSSSMTRVPSSGSANTKLDKAEDQRGSCSDPDCRQSSTTASISTSVTASIQDCKQPKFDELVPVVLSPTLCSREAGSQEHYRPPMQQEQGACSQSHGAPFSRASPQQSGVTIRDTGHAGDWPLQPFIETREDGAQQFPYPHAVVSPPENTPMAPGQPGPWRVASQAYPQQCQGFRSGPPSTASLYAEKVGQRWRGPQMRNGDGDGSFVALRADEQQKIEEYIEFLKATIPNFAALSKRRQAKRWRRMHANLDWPPGRGMWTHGAGHDDLYLDKQRQPQQWPEQQSQQQMHQQPRQQPLQQPYQQPHQQWQQNMGLQQYPYQPSAPQEQYVRCMGYEQRACLQSPVFPLPWQPPMAVLPCIHGNYPPWVVGHGRG